VGGAGSQLRSNLCRGGAQRNGGARIQFLGDGQRRRPRFLQCVSRRADRDGVRALRGGLSHNEAESALPGDLAAGANVLLHAMLSMASAATT